MKNALLLWAVTSLVYGQVLEPNSPYNQNYPQQPYLPDSSLNGSAYRPNSQVPYGSFPVNGNVNDYSSPVQPQSHFYQDSFNSDTYGEGDDNEIDPQNTASYYAGLDYEERYRCPPNWIRYRESCYRFTKSPDRPRNEARKICQAYEADLAAVNSPEEHGFIITSLMRLDPQKGSWYVGAHQQTPGYWSNDADGSQLSGLENAFFDDRQLTYQSYNLLPRDYLVYRFSKEDGRWGLSPVEGTQYFHFICEGLSQRLRYLFEEQRSFTYGLDTYDPLHIPRGPYFIQEPVNTVYDPVMSTFVHLTCIAGGFPSPSYNWYKEDFELDRPVFHRLDPLNNTRYVISGGTLLIYSPDAEKDSTKYHCTATNKFGTIRSESVLLSFGYIREFNQKRPVESGNQYWGKVMYCDPPSYYPAVNFLWARGYFPNLVEEDKRVFVSYDGGLYFSALEAIDRGNYSCNVMSKVSDAGRNGPFFPLYVYPHSDYQQLKFPNNFPKVFPEAPYVGQEVRLECVTFGYPVPSYNWTRKNENLPRKAQLSNFNRVLTIPHVGVEDEGEYICEVRNDRARISNSVFLKVQAEPNFTIPLTDKHMDNDGELHWNCEAFGIPDVNYTWWKNGVKLSMETLEPEDRDRYIIQDNVLTIRHLHHTRDPGMYQCEAKNQLKTSYSSGQLRVLSLKPSFKKRPLESETYGSEGGNVTIKCNPEAAPKPTFTWKKDNIVIGAGGKRFITENGNLIIRQISRDDEGIYTCIAKNKYGTDESRGRLLVLRAPRFIERLQPRMTVQVTETIFLHCSADIDPLLDIAYFWKHNGLRMKEAADLYADRRIYMDGGELTIYNVSLADTGDYECIVKSAIGRISSHMQLRVEGPPGAPGGLQVLNIQRAAVTLEWTDSGSNGRPITSYIVSGRTQWNATWTVINDNVVNVMEVDRYNGRKRAVINSPLLPWSVYEFRVQAVNLLGFGTPSAPSPQFSTLPDKPYTAPDNIGGGGGKIGDLTIKWTPLPLSHQNGPGIHYKIFWRRNGTEVEFQSLLLNKYGNIGMYVVHIALDYFYTKYDVKVQAFNSMGAGPESAVAAVYSAEDMPQVAPQQVYARSYNSTALNVTWNPIDQSRERLRGKLIGHRLKYWKQANKEEECIYYLSRTTRNWALVVGLQPDTYYFVKVMAFNSAGEGPESERYLERTFRKAPQKPPASVNVWAVNPSTVRVVWRYVQPTDEEEPLIGYKVRVWEIDQDMSTANDTLVPVDRKLEAYVTSLTPGKTYRLRVLGYSNGGDGRMSSPTITFQMGDYHSDSYGYYVRSNNGAATQRVAIEMLLIAGLSYFTRKSMT
ncbi:contactin [Plutella xylostella]|uniref:contactin n=1 Tax=Plutella xylostella TaxID=51655 RepID=UPI0020331289|nr:contactin [Plutella xylostella]